MVRTPALISMVLIGALLCLSGCQSPYHADRGALLGGLFGAGAGAIVGDQTGHAGEGAAVGAGLGALGGALVGNAVDESEAKNRAEIAQQLGRQVAAGAVTINDVIAMTAAGVDEELIVNHVRNNGMAAPLQAGDLIHLQQQGVSTRVVSVMQEPPRQPTQPVAAQQAMPMIVEEYHYVPCNRPRYHHPPPPGIGWAVTVGN